MQHRSLIDCPFTLNADNLWQCPKCNWVYKKKSDKPPRRNCPALLTPEEKAKREAERQQQQHLAQHGPGAHLHRLIKKYTGEGITAKCGCVNRIAEMNRRGPAWCRDNMQTIIGWMEEEIKRRTKQADTPPRWRLRLAGLGLPGQRTAIRWLVLRACKLAERAPYLIPAAMLM